MEKAEPDDVWQKIYHQRGQHRPETFPCGVDAVVHREEQEEGTHDYGAIEEQYCPVGHGVAREIAFHKPLNQWGLFHASRINVQ